jgi:hypothetical protein
MPSKNGKNTTILIFQTVFWLDSFSNVPMSVQNIFQIPQAIEESIKAPLRDNKKRLLVQGYVAKI